MGMHIHVRNANSLNPTETHLSRYGCFGSDLELIHQIRFSKREGSPIRRIRKLNAKSGSTERIHSDSFRSGVPRLYHRPKLNLDDLYDVYSAVI